MEPGQHAPPIRPQAPPMQPPASHVPSPMPHELPESTHAPLTQQPPASHACPGQQGSPSPPHAVHASGGVPGGLKQTSPGAVQKPGEPKPPTRQQGSPSPPQVNIADEHAPSMHVVVMPHIMPSAWQVPETQQPSLSHEPPSQQGSSSPPQSTIEPARQTIAPVPSPGARQLPPAQHAPPSHMSPAQHG